MVVTALFAVLITAMVCASHATYARSPAGVRAIPLGLVQAVNGEPATTTFVAVATTTIWPLVESVAKTCDPSGLMATPSKVAPGLPMLIRLAAVTSVGTPLAALASITASWLFEQATYARSDEIVPPPVPLVASGAIWE